MPPGWGNQLRHFMRSSVVLLGKLLLLALAPPGSPALEKGAHIRSGCLAPAGQRLSNQGGARAGRRPDPVPGGRAPGSCYTYARIVDLVQR